MKTNLFYGGSTLICKFLFSSCTLVPFLKIDMKNLVSYITDFAGHRALPHYNLLSRNRCRRAFCLRRGSSIFKVMGLCDSRRLDLKLNFVLVEGRSCSYELFHF